MRRNKNLRQLRLNQLDRRDVPTVTANGGNFLVNSFTTGSQSAPAIAMDGMGDYVTVWQDLSQEGSNNAGIYAHRITAGGVKSLPDFHVNDFTTGNQLAPAISMDAVGDFVIVWQSANQDGSGTGIYGQRYNSGGGREGVQFRVNSYTPDDQTLPNVAMDALGNFVVVWQSNGADGNGLAIDGQRYDARGIPQGPEFVANTFTTGAQFEPRVAMDYTGDFAVTWTSDGQDGNGYGVYAQRFNAAGTKQGGEFRVSASTIGDQNLPSVAMDGAGNFVIALESDVSGGSTIQFQRYDNNGANLGGGTINQAGLTTPSVSRSANADFVIAAELKATQTLPAVINAYTFQPGGFETTPQPGVSTNTTGNDSNAAVAMDAKGDYVVAWEGVGSGDSAGVFAQSYLQSFDSAGPRITGMYTPLSAQNVPDSGRLTASVSQLTVSFDEAMSTGNAATSVTNTANWTLTHDGTPVANSISSITFFYNFAAQRFDATLNLAQPLGGGQYSLAPSNLTDTAGKALDGNYDGIPGGAYSRSFDIGIPVAIGPELKVNTTVGPSSHITMAQSASASFPNGTTVVAWRGSSANANAGVFAQVYRPDGTPFSAEISVSATGQGRIAVAASADNLFVVTYSRMNGSDLDVFAHYYGITGSSFGSEIQVNTTTVGTQQSVAVAIDASGHTVFAWETPGQGSNTRVFAQRMYLDGSKLGNEFQVDDGPTFNESVPTVACDQAGNFVIAWQGFVSGPGVDIYARRYNAVGERQGNDFQVNAFTTGNQLDPAAAMDAAGNFVITWESPQQAGAGSSFDIFARRYDSAGDFVGNEFLVNTFTTGVQEFPSISASLPGDFVIAWNSNSQEGGDLGVFAQRISSLGTKLGTEIHVNTTTADDQNFPAVAVDGDGDFLIAWQSYEAGHSTIKAQRFGIAPPRVQSVLVNGGEVQRSIVSSVQVEFDSSVVITGNPNTAFGLTRNGDNAIVTFTTDVVPVGGQTVVELSNFGGSPTQSGSLADGLYTLRVFASRVSGPGGALDGDGNTVGGDDYVLVGTPANGLFRLFGDSDGNGVVNNADFLAFRSAFGASSSIFDVNNSGTVDASDFLAFRSRFGSSV